MPVDVVPLKAHNIIKREYKEHSVTFQLDKRRKTWSWTFNHTIHLTFSGEDCPSLDDAIKGAYKNIDKIMG